ncbi:monofunctional biosynthetic peptidoglycan transglycosylase [Insolitispirillum peregrinum]|uniref:Biosynthetic peptidoglycan transglycosylase n=1 Tax=Insolitispirillum peregrinum TaxID=80876 RepID=A0A1N7JUS9_9PROT|nr:monofunctional biosynthetic peptidoglycan transglycosylase [Insolitispirillum peregrinum]SIS53099.1 monofunctional biosynthetic peptidoglycan transglycosylase [Insolitispirillum peregrinum]
MGKPREMIRTFGGWVRRGVIGLVALLAFGPPLVLAVYRVVPPPVTPLMLLRSIEGQPIRKDWTPLDRISPALARSVIASEDNFFCQHRGFDLSAFQQAVEGWWQGKGRRGGSTISQQTAKNLLLLPSRTVFRKALEAYATIWLELLWSKERILEVYLNIAEWGPGIYGAEAAAQAHFNRPAASLTARQAATLAVVLPNPLRWSAAHPPGSLVRRAGMIQGRVAQLSPDLLECSGP